MATTHGLDTEQRLVDLPIASRTSTSLSVTLTSNRNIAPAGWYMLFVRINLAQASVTPLVQLRLNNNSWGNGLQSLLCNNANQLIAFGAPRYIQPNALYTVDLSSGAMAKLVDFDAAR
ncbi:MAG: DUF1929 domain-containing protein, partial [Chroococcidiopsis sp.]